jgi:hypothetical protein
MIFPKTLEYSRSATPEHSPQYVIYDPDGDGRDIAMVRGEEQLAVLFANTTRMFSVCKNALADLEGIMPEFEPSGDRTHPAWKTIRELYDIISDIQPE